VLAEDGAGRTQPEAGHWRGGTLAANKTVGAARCSGPRLEAVSGMPRDDTVMRRAMRGKQVWGHGARARCGSVQHKDGRYDDDSGP
jgi:hypothetical protein